MNFTITDKDHKLVSYSGQATEVNMVNEPAEIISDCFEGQSWIKFVKLPTCVKELEDDCFHHCENLTGITLGTRHELTKIGNSAFYGCTKLNYTGIIPDSVEKIGDNAFRECQSLTNVWCEANIQTVPSSCWEGCVSLNDVELFNAETISGFAFHNCKNLKAINLPNNLIRIYSQAFLDCESLTHITIPAKVNYIGTSVFNGCRSLHTLEFMGDDNSGGLAICEYAFAGCNALTEVNFPKNIAEIRRGAFMNCHNLERVSFGDDRNINILSECDKIFFGCEKLAEIDFPSFALKKDLILRKWVKVDK